LIKRKRGERKQSYFLSHSTLLQWLGWRKYEGFSLESPIQKWSPKVEKVKIVCIRWMDEKKTQKEEEHGPVCAIQIVPEVEVASIKNFKRWWGFMMKSWDFFVHSCILFVFFELWRSVSFSVVALCSFHLHLPYLTYLHYVYS